MTDPPLPMASASSPDDDDPTGVRALLSGLPEPDPMPAHLVERINASLAAAQAQRAASTAEDSVTPLVPSMRRRPGRALFAIAGAAAAVALIAVLGGNLFRTLSPTGSASSDTAAIASSSGEAGRGGPPAAPDKAKALAAKSSTPPLIQVRQSETRYTRAEFATQARTLRSAAYGSSLAYGPTPSMAAETPGVGRLGTAAGLTDCLRAVGADRAQMVRADLALYDGVPAVIIVATTDGIPMAYALGRECSLADPAVLRAATPLP